MSWEALFFFHGHDKGVVMLSNTPLSLLVICLVSYAYLTVCEHEVVRPNSENELRTTFYPVVVLILQLHTDIPTCCMKILRRKFSQKLAKPQSSGHNDCE